MPQDPEDRPTAVSEEDRFYRRLQDLLGDFSLSPIEQQIWRVTVKEWQQRLANPRYCRQDFQAGLRKVAEAHDLPLPFLVEVPGENQAVVTASMLRAYPHYGLSYQLSPEVCQVLKISSNDQPAKVLKHIPQKVLDTVEPLEAVDRRVTYDQQILYLHDHYQLKLLDCRKLFALPDYGQGPEFTWAHVEYLLRTSQLEYDDLPLSVQGYFLVAKSAKAYVGATNFLVTVL